MEVNGDTLIKYHYRGELRENRIRDMSHDMLYEVCVTKTHPKSDRYSMSSYYQRILCKYLNVPYLLNEDNQVITKDE